MYRLSINERKHGTTPIVRVTIDANGKEQEEIVLCAINMKKKDGEALSKLVIDLLSKDEENDNPYFLTGEELKKTATARK